MEKEMATHSNTLAWKIPWMEEPGRLQSMGSQSWMWLSNFTFFVFRWFSGKEFACQFRRCRFHPCVGKIPWRRKWQPTPVFLSGESHGQRSLVGYCPWSCKELDMTEWLTFPLNDVRRSPFFHNISSIYCLQTFRWWPFWLVWSDASL